MLHSRQRPRRSQQSANASPPEDPYSPSSPGYAERNRAFVSEVQDIPGLVRVDIGAAAPKQS